MTKKNTLNKKQEKEFDKLREILIDMIDKYFPKIKLMRVEGKRV